MNRPQNEAALERELSVWNEAGKTVRFFLRDDDAIADTPALRRLFRFCEKQGVALLLACIPKLADASLGAAVRGFPLATGAVHGFAHASHTPKGEKPCELDRYRPLASVLGELRQGRQRLGDLFGGKLSGLVVPPWNRIHDEVAVHVHEAGFAGISAHGWLSGPPPLKIASVNAHVDIVHWSGGRTGRHWDWVAGELATALREARRRGWRAVGILAHHLAHDEQAWAVLQQVGGFAAARRIEWIAADALVSEPAEQPVALHPQA